MSLDSRVATILCSSYTLLSITNRVWQCMIQIGCSLSLQHKHVSPRVSRHETWTYRLPNSTPSCANALFVFHIDNNAWCFPICDSYCLRVCFSHPSTLWDILFTDLVYLYRMRYLQVKPHIKNTRLFRATNMKLGLRSYLFNADSPDSKLFRYWGVLYGK